MEVSQPKKKSARKPKLVPIFESEDESERGPASPADIEILKDEIKRTINGYKRYGMIEYGDAFDCFVEISEIMETNSEALLENGRYKEAFDYSFYVMKKFCSTDMDDSDGGTGLLCSGGTEIWEEAIKDADAEKYVFDKLLKYKGTASEWYLKDISEDFLFDNFNKSQFNDQKLKYADKRIEELKKEGEFGEYELGGYLKKKAKLLREMNASEEVFEKFCAENWKYSEIQIYCIDEKIESGKYKEAEKLLLKCLARPVRSGITTEYCRHKLMKIYKQIGDKEAYRNTLCDYVSFEIFCDIEEYKELKRLYTAEEWGEVRDRVQKNVGKHNRDLLPEIFSFEGQTDRLLKFAVAYPGISYIKEYEKELMPYYPAEVLKKYKDEFLKMTASASSRDTYKEIVRDLRRLSKYEGGKALARELVTEWREKYPNRRAMMEELNKIVISKK